MPTTINGIGTRYAGRKNLETRVGTCEHCGREATLSSYDTRLVFAVLFIPVVPLGRKRVFEECSRCHRHRAMPLDAYRAFQEETLTRLEAEHRQAPENAAAALAYNAALFEFQRHEEGERHLETLAGKFPREAEVQFYLGGVHERSGRAEEADRCFDRAFELDPSRPEVRRARAVQLLERGQLGEARSLLLGAGAPAEQDPQVLFLLARAFQDRADHLTALMVFEELVKGYPELGRDKNFRQAVDASEKEVKSPVSILPPRRLPWGKVAAAASIVLLLAGGAAGWSLYRQSAHTVHVVNGFPGPLTVAIDGAREVAFEDQGRKTVTVGEGRHRVEVRGALEDSFEFQLHRGFFQRFAADPVWVLNPGGLALVMAEETVYTNKPRPEYQPAVRFYAGRRFLQVQDIDYPFRDFPDTIELSSSTREATRRRMTELLGRPEDLAGAVAGWGHPGAAMDYLERWLEAAPSDELALTYSGSALLAGAGARAADFLQPRLAVDPVNVEWHRAYQQVVEPLAERAESLVAEYDGYLAAAPDDPQLLYLRGRIEPDPALAQQFYRRALAGDPQNVHAARASAYTLMAQADFGGALQVLQPLAGGADADPQLVELYHESLFAVGRQGALEAALRTELAAAEEDLDWSKARLLLHSLVSQGRAGEAAGEVDRLEALVPVEDGEPPIFGPWLEAQLLYAAGDLEAFERLVGDREFPELWRDSMGFWLAVEKGEMEAANRAINRVRPGTDEGIDRLLMGLLYARQGLGGLSRQWLDRGLEVLRERDASYRLFERLLAGEEPLDRRSVDRLVTRPGEKAVLLTVLAVRHPDQASWLLTEAARLNYDLGFPHRFLSSFES